MDPIEALRCVLGRSPDPVVALDASGRVVFENDAARARWGGTVPDDVRRALAEDRTRFEHGETGPAGVRAWFASTVAPLVDGIVVVTSTEVTELKRSEMRLRRSEELLVDAQGVAHLGTWDWDVSEPNATWSAELYRIYGLTPETYTPSYEAYLTKIHPDDRQRVIDATNRVFHEHVPYSHDERIFRPDGSMRYLHTWAFPVLDEGGKLVRLVGVCQDITDRKLAEEEVLHLNADLERRVAERVKDLEAFQAMLSHDLRAPLSVIQMAAGLLARDALVSPAATKNVERIERSVLHMTRLVEDLLTLAHVGNTKLELAPIDLSAMVQEVVANLRRGAPGRAVTVTVAPGLTTRGDPGLVRTVLENLIGNAWKYSSRIPDAKIEIGRDQGGFFVKDDGAGFDMSQVHRLFAPFERLHEQKDFAGTGVGLAAVRRIVERHGGTIRAEGAPGKGATFWFTLGA